ncbi:hypothetical protein [Oribacterium sp. NK2B42]|uniref:hypothetical protein n=1 Tax=Oribacterium sp. NK2B42 TaxID=689781 RepID=UPI00041865C4|nr:hypothetical protein [Oribacterium sp. NK2B42]
MKIIKKLGIIGGISIMGLCSMTGAMAGYRGITFTSENIFSVVAGKSNDNDAATIIEDELDKILYGPDGEEGTSDDGEGDPDYLMALDPGAEKTKDPAIRTNVAFDSLVFVKVEVPLLKGTISGKDGAYEAMRLMKNGTSLNDLSVGDEVGDFKLMKVEKSDSTEKKSVYYFGFMGTLEGTDHEDEKLNETSTLFDTFIVNDFTAVDGKYFTADADVDISAFIMQDVNPETHMEYKNIDEAWKKLLDADVIDSDKD